MGSSWKSVSQTLGTGGLIIIISLPYLVQYQSIVYLLKSRVFFKV
jgi:hypothetical protein